MKQIPSEIPYLLRIVALIFFFNGLFSLVRTVLSSLSLEGFFLDPRIINILIALGLIARKRFLYMLAILSAGANVTLHALRLTEFASTGAWTVFYFLVAISIDIFQLSVLLRKNVRTLYFQQT